MPINDHLERAPSEIVSADLMTQSGSIHGLWSNRWAFVLAATGSAVGLGNIWKFPYMTGQNGGGAFVLVYLICIVFITLPILMAEVLLGRRGRRSPIFAMAAVAREAGCSVLWSVIGWMGVVAGFLILSYYSVIAGWTLAYVPRAATGAFAGGEGPAIAALFDGLLASPGWLTLWHTLFMVSTVFVVGRGLQAGIERAVTWLMPGLFIILLGLVAYAATLPSFAQGVDFLFTPDFSKLNAEVVLKALGQAFFTLSLGMGAIMVYGAYLPEESSITRTSLTVCAADTTVALLAGLAIFPLVFAHGLMPGEGPGLIFLTLPAAFGQMPGGVVIGTLFFVLLLVAAFTSALSLIEPAVAWGVERFDTSRAKAAAVCGLLAWLLGLATVFSFNLAENYKPIGGMTLFELLDYLTSNIMLPAGGALIAVFVAWFMRDEHRRAELRTGAAVLYPVWLWLLRIVAPVGVALVFLQAIGVDLGLP